MTGDDQSHVCCCVVDVQQADQFVFRSSENSSEL